jgi:RNA polymerase sigma-70 factor (ECF subfamily)
MDLAEAGFARLAGPMSDRPPRVAFEVAVAPSFASFYRREFQSMVALAYAVSGSRSAAEDLAQEALMRAYRDWERISAYEKPGAWLRRVTINLATSAARRRAVEVRALVRLRPNGEWVPEPDPGDAALWDALSKLPGKQRAAASLFYLEDRSPAEIAEALGCKEATARVHLHRSRRALADAVGAAQARER